VRPPEREKFEKLVAVYVFEDRQDLLGHRSGRIISHYPAAELINLIKAANQVVGRGSRTGDAEEKGG
jgi:hypothetical protein